MQKKKLTVEFQEGDHINELPQDIQDLINSTISFAKNAYAPYSNFHVSAGLILDNKETLFGTNVENGSYPVSICAERTLLSHAVSNYPNNKINLMAVYVDKEVGVPVPPCGVCRQTFIEVELKQKSPIEIYLVSKEGKYYKFDSAADLLPLFFDGSVL